MTKAWRQPAARADGSLETRPASQAVVLEATEGEKQENQQRTAPGSPATTAPLTPRGADAQHDKGGIGGKKALDLVVAAGRVIPHLPASGARGAKDTGQEGDTPTSFHHLRFQLVAPAGPGWGRPRVLFHALAG